MTGCRDMLVLGELYINHVGHVGLIWNMLKTLKLAAAFLELDIDFTPQPLTHPTTCTV